MSDLRKLAEECWQEMRDVVLPDTDDMDATECEPIIERHLARAAAWAMREIADEDPPDDALEHADTLDLFAWTAYCEWLRNRADALEKGLADA